MGGAGASEIARVLLAEGIDLSTLGLAWARATPAVVIVPAFGLRALPQGARLVFALALAASVYPACVPLGAAAAAPWPAMVLAELLRGLPLAIAASIPLWAATMTGGLVDTLRGSTGDGASLAVIEGRSTQLAGLLGMLAACLFLTTGGPARVAHALVVTELPPSFLVQLAETLTAGIGIAVALGAPLIAASVVLEIATALIARSATPAQVGPLLAPAKNLAMVALLGLLLERLSIAFAGILRP